MPPTPEKKPDPASFLLPKKEVSAPAQRINAGVLLEQEQHAELPKTEPAPASPAPIADKSEVSPLQTYRSDIEQVVREGQGVSVVSIAAAEAQRRGKEPQKTPEEIAKITRACAITTQAFNALVREFSLNKFKTEQDVAFFLEKFIRERGAELAFPTIVASGKNSATPHHVTSSAKLTKGFLQLDLGACYKNYCSDMSRSLYIGKPSSAEKAHYQLLRQAQEKMVGEIAINKSFAELEKISRKSLGKYSSYFIHSLGHGVGVEIHEAPVFSKEAKQTIKPNHIFTIEPGIYFPRKYGIRIEDTILFNGKAKILTAAPKELIFLK